MMKYAFVSLAALLIVGSSALPLEVNYDEGTDALDREFEDFYKLLDLDEVVRVVKDHAEDPELQKSLDYMMSDDFHKLVYAAEDLPEFQKYVLFLQAAGYNAIRELRYMHEFYGMKDYVPPVPTDVEEVQMAEMKRGGGFDSFIEDLVAILPKKELRALHQKKVKESPVFAKYRNAIFSPKFASIRAALYDQKAFQILLSEAKANGFDFIKAYTFRYQLFGFY